MNEIHIQKNIQNTLGYYQNNDMVGQDTTLVITQLKKRCSVCQTKSAVIVGDCKYCGLKYCAIHRLPESHKCPNMDDCKRESFQSNSDRVMRQKCVAVKI